MVGDCRWRRRFRRTRFDAPSPSRNPTPSPCRRAHLDIRGLQIAVDDPLLVRRLQRLRDLLRDRQRLVDRNRPLRDAMRQSPRPRRVPSRALGRRGFFEAVNLRDVRMVQRCEGLRFAPEPREPIGIAARTTRAALQRDSRFSFVSRARYTSPMPPAPIGGKDFVRPEACAGVEGQTLRDIRAGPQRLLDYF